MTGTIFNIQRFCLHDGPGTRTTVFLKGCPLRCAWCHNPEGLSARRQMMLDMDKCARCGACAAVCPRHRVSAQEHAFDRAGCVTCGRCADACPAGAIEAAGREVTVEDVMATVRRDKPFYRRGGGGMTLSGGEPTLQADFARALAQAAHAEDIGVCMETCGFCDERRFAELAQYVDIFLFDIKETDPVLHSEYTGQDNALILRNLRALDGMGKPIVLRCPVIPGYNDRPGHFAAVAQLAESLAHVQRIELEPYHPLGLSKAARLDMATDARLSAHSMPRDAAQRIADTMTGLTDVPVIVS